MDKDILIDKEVLLILPNITKYTIWDELQKTLESWRRQWYEKYGNRGTFIWDEDLLLLKANIIALAQRFVDEPNRFTVR